jgi:hypothetical protein
VAHERLGYKITDMIKVEGTEKCGEMLVKRHTLQSAAAITCLLNIWARYRTLILKERQTFVHSVVLATNLQYIT